MYSSIIVLFTAVVAAFAAELSINTPAAVTACKAVTITWQDGQGPYSVSIVDGDNPCDEALVNLGQTKDTWLKWASPSVKPGQKIIIALEDSSEEEVWTSVLTVQKGSDTGCLAAASGTAPVDYSRAAPVAPAATGGVSSSGSDTPVNVGQAISPATRTTVSPIVAAILAVVGVAASLVSI